jgi:hypothetical protein
LDITARRRLLDGYLKQVLDPLSNHLMPAMISTILSVSLSLSFASKALGATYNLAKSTAGNAFLTDFNVISETDPTGGLVYVTSFLTSQLSPNHILRDYVDLATAKSLGLVTVANGNFQLKPDSTTVLTGGAGRKSVRMESVTEYTQHVTM